MKKIIYLYLIFIFFIACEEIPPTLNPITDAGTSIDTTLANQQQNVLIEEFTGVRCVNCPAGSEAIENLLSIYGNRLSAISIHAGFFSPPYPSSQNDFRTEEGNNLLNYLGSPLGYPTAVVNRRLYDGEFDLQVSQNQWAGFIAEDITKTPKAKMRLTSDYNALTRALEVNAEVFVQEAILEDDVRLSVALTESNIDDKQLTPQGEQDDYTHKHVLRTMLTNYDGNPIEEALLEGTELSRSFQYILPEEFVAANCTLVAFIHLNGEEKDILQVVEVPLSE